MSRGAWTTSCEEIHRWYSVYGRDRWTGTSIHRMQTTFPIPVDARWMTVTTNDTADLRWTLT